MFVHALVATTHIVNIPDPKTMSKNKKKKMKKKEKIKQKMLELTQQQIQVHWCIDCIWIISMLLFFSGRRKTETESLEFIEPTELQ